ncbi:MAG: glycerophosphodiester phosphodiesterase family protein [Akkermansiaceae bacterium]|nr:glycerophosphodiester phosphodiesterase family protein [Akkermansiaceae bacterium]
MNKYILKRGARKLTSALLGCLGLAASVNAETAITAHRGASSDAPENTISSISAAAGIADYTEMDARLSSDGELVLMHDSTIDRTTNGTGAVSSKSLAELKALDAGSWFSPSYAGEQVPTLTEAMNAALSAGVAPMVERKAGSASDYHNEFTTNGFSTNDFAVISFDWNFLDALDTLNSSYQLGALGSGSLTQTTVNNALADGADFISWRSSDIDQAKVDLVKSNGLGIQVWTVNNAGRMQQLLDYGVDYITTDNPSLLSSLMADRELSLSNLLLNSGFEDGLNSWTTSAVGPDPDAAVAIRSESPDPLEGSAYIYGDDTPSFTAYQDVDLVAAGFSAATIDLGGLNALFGGYQAGYTNDADYGIISLEFLDGGGSSLGISSLDAYTSELSWAKQSSTVDVLSGTRTIRYSFTGTRLNGLNNDAYLDLASLVIVVPEPSSVTLLGLGGLAFTLCRRKRS